MTKVGSHFIIDAQGIDPTKLDDLDFIRSTLLSAAIGSGCTILHTHFHKFSPQGVSGFVLISESHLSIHTYPEIRYASIDIFTCGSTVRPLEALKSITDAFGGGPHEVRIIDRGSVPELMSIAIG